MRIFFELWLEIRKRYVVESCAYQKLNVLPTTSDHEQPFIGINMASFDIAQKNSQELVSPFFGARCPYLLFRDRRWSHTRATHGSSFHCHFIFYIISYGTIGLSTPYKLDAQVCADSGGMVINDSRTIVWPDSLVPCVRI